MHFAYPVPWWLVAALAAAVGSFAYFEYRRPLSPLTPAQRVAGIIVLSDGGDTGQQATAAGALPGPPVFAVGLGSPEGVRDREVLGITAGDPRLDQSSVDLHVSAISSGFGRTPFQLRVLTNGRIVESRRVVPPADGSPIDETFTVSPDALNAAVYTAEIPADEADPVVENTAH